jgi:hypothetical protein
VVSVDVDTVAVKCHAAIVRLITTFILSIRSPGPVTPYDIECEGFSLTYTRIASDYNSKPATASAANNSNTSHPHRGSSNHHGSNALVNNVDQKVDDAIESFLRNLSQIGPELLSVGETCGKRGSYVLCVAMSTA